MPDANLLGWFAGADEDGDRGGEIETNVTPLATWVWREELMTKAFEI